MSRPLLALVNPAAGGGRCGRLAGPELERLRAAGVELEVRQMRERGEATEVTRAAWREGYRRFLAVGGDGTSYEIVKGLFPEAIDADGSVNRATLRALIQTDRTVLDRLNAAVHPLVAADRAAFIAAHKDAEILLLDVPLLYEIGLEPACDAVAVVSAPPEVQRQRVLDRGAMTEAEFQTILARQMPDREKRSRATHILETLSLDSVRAGVRALIGYLTGPAHA